MNALSIAAIAAAAALAVVQPGPAEAQSAQDIFVSACIDGGLSASAATNLHEVGYGELPGELRDRMVKTPQSAKVWTDGSGTWLYLFDNPNRRGQMKKVCGIISDGVDFVRLSSDLDGRLAGGGLMPGENKSIRWERPQDGYEVTVINAVDYVIAQVDWYSDKDRHFRKDRIDIVDR